MEAGSPQETSQEQPHLVSLVLQSKKALQHGGQVCSEAQSLSNASAQVAVDVLTLDAKVRWISDSVLEQLKLSASVAKIIEEKRARLKKQVQEWEETRVKQCDKLEAILEELGSQQVPPEFHQTSVESSLFGSQHSEDEHKPNGTAATSGSPSDTVLQIPPSKRTDDRKSWKTLRDFVDDQAIEEILEAMENERITIGDTMSNTDEYPESLNHSIANIRNSLPEIQPTPSIEQLFHHQNSVTVPMARHLESLASHYDQMATALHDSEAGEVFSDEDVQQMNRDTDELPSIMTELEESLTAVNEINQTLITTRSASERHIQQLAIVLNDLDELGDIMGEMLQQQEAVETQCEERLVDLQTHLSTIEDLYERYVDYQVAYRKLVLELSRRRLYKESVEKFVRGMISELESMTVEERHIRDRFNNEYGIHLPEDLCLCIRNAPTRWAVHPQAGEELETLPDIPPDLIAVARGGTTSSPVPGTESL
ncbi:Autophagy-related protein 17 [Marasmius crinis-equi]|uniref:Autophagy-related protein 17 n=1 Tax=Marasmius crinis-equi TaxID=585013 RepID=A0ABR3G005_9AGAR